MSMELHSRSSIRDSTFFFRIKRQEDSTSQPEDRPTSGSRTSTSGREHYHNQTQEYLYG